MTPMVWHQGIHDRMGMQRMSQGPYVRLSVSRFYVNADTRDFETQEVRSDG